VVRIRKKISSQKKEGGGVMEIQLELDLNHEDSLNDWACRLADDDIATGYHTNWDHAYECAWQSLDAEYNYEIVRP